MNKAELINAVAEKAGIAKVDAKKALDATIEAIAESMKKDEKVSLVGFGSFSVVTRKERMGRNPRAKKGEKAQLIKIPAKKVVKFKAGAGLSL
ncbi:MAG: HU family DNA-binding protein [Bacteroidales bacterium]|nr:HU family DNA-binding protein [Bacteroidales bacterium]MDD6581649.1 HU family DNA-binding protein [Bacteroidales bacterium]